MMNEMCPISLTQVNEKAVQMSAALTVFSLVLFFFTPFKWILLILLIDFFIRGFLDASYSFYSYLSKTILNIFKIKPSMVNAGPKIFAAKIGFLFSCMIAAAYLLDFKKAGMVIGLIFILCAALEAIFRFCVACKLYPYIHKK